MSIDDTQLLNELVVLYTIGLKRGATQGQLIDELFSAGFQPKRIAELLGTTPNTVSVYLSKKERKRKSAK